MKKVFLLAVAVAMCVGCNQDVQLHDYEDTPKVAEHIVGMTSQKAIAYLEKQGFCYKGESESVAPQYIFSKDKKFSEFSMEASIMLGFNVSDDTIRSVATVHRMETEESARALFLKWSKYTAKVTFPSPQEWQGYLILKESHQTSNYCGGAWIEQAKEAAQKGYESGRFTKEEYDELMAIYSRTQEMYWSDYEKAGDKLYSAGEGYKNVGPDYPIKEIDMYLYTNNGGNIELHYETRDYNIWYCATEPE